jgi:hypothetical protein
MPICSSDERAAMPGYLTPAQMAEVRKAAGVEFNAILIRMMSLHHAGGCSDGGRRVAFIRRSAPAADGAAIRREQKGEIAFVKNVSGIEAVRQVTRSMSAFTLFFGSPEASTRRSPCTEVAHPIAAPTS